MEKTRDISKIDFFELLQKEYISADFRRKIYYKPNDKTYWKRVCEFKKDKIVSLSSELGLTNLFQDQDKKLELILNFKNEGGRPNFYYKKDGSDKHLEKTDLLNYYRSGSDIKVISSGKLGQIIKTTDYQILELGEVIISVENVNSISKLEEISRIV